MPSWSVSISSPEDKGDEVPWNVAILSYLQFKEVLLDAVTIPDPDFREYKDPEGTAFTTQFKRLKLFLDAKTLDRNGQVWKDLQEADPGFRKIQIVYELSDPTRKEMGWPEEHITSFPEEWRDEHYFICWFYVNLLSQIKCLDTGTLERVRHVMLHTNYIQTWRRCGEEQRAMIEEAKAKTKQTVRKNETRKLVEEGLRAYVLKHHWRKSEKELDELKAEKEKKKVEKEKKRHEAWLAKESRELRRLDKAENN